MNFCLICSDLKTAMLTTISKLLKDPLFWRILAFGSSIVGFTSFALSPSFYELFGRWNLFKSFIYSVISLSVITTMLFVKKCRRFTRSVLVKTIVGFLVLMLTSLFSIWQDLNSQKENDEEKGSHGRILKLCSFGAFGLMSLSWSRQLQLGFEVGISDFLFGTFLVLLMKINIKLVPLAAFFCYVYMNIRSFSDPQTEMRDRVDKSDTVLLEDIESGNTNHGIDLQRMNLAEHMHKNRLKEHAEKSHIPPPIYQAVNIGLAHAPKFRSAVSVNGKSYISKNVFPNLKDAEQDVAKLALKHITTGNKAEDLSLILERPTSFKSLFNDYATKMNLKIPLYNTVAREGLGDFISYFIFNGRRYNGDPAKNKRDAEQSAACAAVLSNL